MLNPISKLREEHKEIERELLELETIMNDYFTNYSNLVHVFKKLLKIWDEHEAREKIVFPFFKEKGIVIPVRQMNTYSRSLNGSLDKIREAFRSGSEEKIIWSLDKDLSKIIDKIRSHIDLEDEVIYRIANDVFREKEFKEMRRLLGKNNKNNKNNL